MRDSLATLRARIVAPEAAVIAALTCAALALGGLAPSRARACSCMAQTPNDALAQASAVFEGHVLEVRPIAATADPAPRREVRLQVVRAWKGPRDREELTVTTPGDSAACGYEFVADQSYLVYAVAQDSGLEVSLCSRTQPIAQASEDLALLGMGSTPVDPNAENPLPEDQTEPKAAEGPQQPPARGGCASCSTARGRAGSAGAALPLALALLALTCRRRS